MNNTQLSGSYKSDDVIFLLKILTDELKELTTEERETAIQSGTSYSKMLPIEHRPSQSYISLFINSLEKNKFHISKLVALLSEKILKKNGDTLVLVSLARAGTPIGILIKRYLYFKYKIHVPHYSVSIIRGIGLDENALNFILSKHKTAKIQFVDGWTGKGAINDTLISSCEKFNLENNCSIDSDLAVISDPGWICSTVATRDDLLIPNACLNSTVSGLISRTVLNDDFISATDFHGAKYYGELAPDDYSKLYVDKISECFNSLDLKPIVSDFPAPDYRGLKEIKFLCSKYNIGDINLIKPGIGETTRVLLRRIPKLILVNSKNAPNLQHIYELANEKNIPIELYENSCYACFGIINDQK